MNRICPQCHLFLEDVTWRDRSIAVCGNCSGVWIPGGIWRDYSPEVIAGSIELIGLRSSMVTREMFAGLNRPCSECRVVNLALDPDTGSDIFSYWFCSK